MCTWVCGDGQGQDAWGLRGWEMRLERQGPNTQDQDCSRELEVGFEPGAHLDAGCSVPLE